MVHDLEDSQVFRTIPNYKALKEGSSEMADQMALMIREKSKSEIGLAMGYTPTHPRGGPRKKQTVSSWILLVRSHFLYSVNVFGAPTEGLIDVVLIVFF